MSKKFIPFTEEEIYTAAHKSIKDYLESIGEKVLHSGTEYMWERHNSVKFRGHVWYRHSTGDKGTAIDFLMYFFDFSFQDAVITLLNGNYKAHRNTRPIDFINEPDKPYKKELILPPKNSDNKRLFAYLHCTRKISANTINAFINRKLIYEDKDNHNIVFVGKDKKGNVKYAGLKGTLTNRIFRIELSGIDRRFGFCYTGGNDALYVFESFIDLFSYIDLYFKNNTWQTCNFLALGGLKFEPIKHYLFMYPQIKEIVICTDNDYADEENHGQIFAELCKNKLKKYNVMIHTPTLKDWNEMLIQQRSNKK